MSWRPKIGDWVVIQCAWGGLEQRIRQVSDLSGYHALLAHPRGARAGTAVIPGVPASSLWALHELRAATPEEQATGQLASEWGRL